MIQMRRLPWRKRVGVLAGEGHLKGPRVHSRRGVPVRGFHFLSRREEGRGLGLLRVVGQTEKGLMCKGLIGGMMLA